MADLKDFLNNGASIIKSRLADGRPLLVVDSTDSEKLEYQMRKNGAKDAAGEVLFNGFRRTTANDWLNLIGGTSGTVAGLLDVQGDSLPMELVADISATITSGCGIRFPQQTFDEAGNPTGAVGFKANAINAISFSISGHAWTVVAPRLPYVTPPYSMIRINAGTLNIYRHEIMFKTVPTSGYGTDNKWHPFSLDEHFSLGTARKKLNRFSKTDVDAHVAGGSQVLRKFEIEREVVASIGDLYKITLWMFFPDVPEIGIDFLPVALDGAKTPAPLAGGAGFNTDLNLSGYRFVSDPMIAWADAMEVAEVDDITALTEEVQTLRGDLNTTREAGLGNKVAIELVGNLEGNPSAIVNADEFVLKFGKIWVNKSGVAKILPLAVAELTEKWFTDEGFVEFSSAPVKNTEGDEILLSTADLEGVAIDAEKEYVFGAWRRAGLSDVIFRSENGKWTENKPPDIPLQRTESEIQTIAKKTLKDVKTVAGWDETFSYDLRDLVSDDGIIYRSLGRLNKGKRPSLFPDQWEDTSKTVQSDIKVNRAPLGSDIYPVGKVWADISYGTKEPILYLSKGGGVWEARNNLLLQSIRLHYKSANATFTTIGNIKILDKDGISLGNVFNVGARGGSVPVGFTGLGQSYKGQAYAMPGNEGFWFDLEPLGSASINGISGVVADYRTIGQPHLHKIEIRFSSGFVREYIFSGAQNGSAQSREINPVQNFPVGASVEALNQHVLSIGEATNDESDIKGQVSGRTLNRVNLTRIEALEARKEVKNGFATSVVVNGETLPDPQAKASGFSNNGSGDVAGATSWNAWAAIGVDVSQSGLATDEYEVSAAFPAAAIFGEITFTLGGARRKLTRTGLEAGSINVEEWTSGDWHGATLRITGDFTGDVAFIGFNGSAYIGPVIRRKRVEGFAVDGQNLALQKDVPQAPNLTGYATKSELVPIVDGLAEVQARGVPDLSKYALAKDIPEVSPAPDLSGLATKNELLKEATDRSAADTALSSRIDALTAAPPAILLAQANAGVALDLGSLRTRIPTGGNRSIQLASNTGADVVLRIQNIHFTGGSGGGIANLTLNAAGTFAYINSSWHFGAAGNFQDVIIDDVTNARFYRLRVEIGGSYNNNSFGGYEIK